MVQQNKNQPGTALVTVPGFLWPVAKEKDRLRAMRPGFPGPVTDPKNSIADLLDLVNDNWQYQIFLQSPVLSASS